MSLPAQALDPSRSLSQFGHSVWRSLDGDFTGNPNSVTQTLDGYVWIGTSTGVTRFDGARFDALVPPAREALARPLVWAVHGARDGSLWIGTPADIEQWKDGHLVHYDLKARVRAISEDAAGDIWATRAGNDDGQGPICRVTGVGLHCFGTSDGVKNKFSTAMATTSDGGVWFASSTTVMRLHGTSVEAFPVAAKGLDDNLNGVDSLAADRDGTMLVGLAYNGPGGGLQRLTSGRLESVDVDGITGSSLKVSSLLVDREGALWIGTWNEGLYRIFNGRADHFRSADGLSSDTVLALFEDMEGNLWICTSSGVDRLRDTRVATYSSRDGLGGDQVHSLSMGGDGAIWISNANSIDRMKDGRVTSLLATDTASGNEFTAVREDSSGRLWVGVDNSLAVLVGKKFKRIPTPNGKPLGVVIDIAQDTDGSVWALALGHPQRLVHVIHDHIAEEVGELPRAATRILAATDGGLWILGQGHSLSRYRDGRLEVKIADDGGPMWEVGVIDLPGKGILVMHDGLKAWRDGRSRRMGVADGLPCDLLYGAVFDRNRALWLYSACGLVRISAEDMATWWERPGFKVKPTVLDATEGARPASTFFSPAMGMSKDGRLWFANGAQLQMVDPEHIRGNAVVPPVHIQAVLADHRRYLPSTTPMVLEPNTRDIEIDYTAPSFVVPQKVRFRYLLEGHDDRWQDAGTRRQAFYTDLPPGNYRFRVVACNNDGVWNEIGATTSFFIPPTFVQTRWFTALCALVAAALLWLAIRLRLRQLSTRIRLGLQERMRERERIARELHDTLLQSTQGLVLMVHGALKMLGANEPAREVLRSAVSHADAVLSEGRDRIRDLRRSGPERQDLVEALGEVGARLANDGTTQFSISVSGEPCPLDGPVEDEFLRIATEALVNAFRHAAASQIVIVIEFSPALLRMTVRDDGKGIAPEAATIEGVPGHWGVPGMRERAQQIGAKIEFRSVPGKGTDVVLTAPAPVAFARSTARRSWTSMFRRHSSLTG